MRISFFGSSILSAYWNGAATYYRGLIRALHARGHRVTFFEPDAYGRQERRDIDPPPWVDVVVYRVEDVDRALEQARDTDVLVKASGVGILDEWLEGAVLEQRRPGTLVVFWDVDAPATLERVGMNPTDPFRARIPRYDAVFTYGGGPPVIEAYHRLGARRCVPIYNGLDPETHHPAPSDRRFDGLLGFLGNRLPDREARVDAFFLEAARRLISEDFVLGGAGWETRILPPNVRVLGHVYTRDHNAFNCTARAVLNITRDSMARTGFSPPTRVFEAAGAGACLFTDAWDGVPMFFEPDEEIFVVQDGMELAERLKGLDPARAVQMGMAARRRAMAEHSYARRAALVEDILEGRSNLRSAG